MTKRTGFGVSGVLYNSDLVFYDRTSKTLWDQIEAKGIVGPRTGETLTLVPLTMTTWSRWRAAHPATLVISPETGFEFDYSRDRYERYRSSDGLMFPVSAEDDRVHPKTVVFGFNIDGRAVAYTLSLLDQEQSHSHELDGRELTVAMDEAGTVTLRDDRGRDYTPTRLFWFAWYTFHPDTELIR